MKGIIERIEDHGTVVLVFLRGSNEPIAFDHRQFSHLWEAEEDDLVGRLAHFDPENRVLNLDGGEFQ